MFNLVEWSPNLDLTDFYKEAGLRGFINNSSQQAMIDCFHNEREWAAWILYQNGQAVGSVAAHSFDDVMGPNSYRILTRVCAFAESAPRTGLLTVNKMMRKHQHISDQFYLPQCIEWAGKSSNLYATSNNNKSASQSLVHNYYFPTLEEMGIVEKIKDLFYRGTHQTIWKFNVGAFEESLNKNIRWSHMLK